MIRPLAAEALREARRRTSQAVSFLIMLTFRPCERTVLAFGLAAVVTLACQAQEFPPQSGPPPVGFTTPNYLPPPGQQPGPSTYGMYPAFAFDPSTTLGAFQGYVTLPPYAAPAGPVPPSNPPPLPELAPTAAAPGPNIGAKWDDAGQWGDMMGFGELGGRGGMGGFGGMTPVDSVRYAQIWFPNVPVRGQATDFQMLGENLSFTHPLWVDPLNALSLTGGVGDRLIETGALLPDTGQAFPADLWNIHLGLRYNKLLENGWMTGGGVSIGSASDHPFAGIREMYFGLNAMLRIPQGEHNAWLFTLMYSPTSELNFPVPGVAYSYNPSPEFHANLGLPLMVTWRPTEQWQFQASYMLLRTVHVKATWRFAPRLSAFAAYDYCNEAYSLLDRPDVNDRFFMYDQRVSLGLQSAFTRHWTASLAGGYVFGRYAFEGTSSTAASGEFDRLDFGNGPFLSVTLAARY